MHESAVALYTEDAILVPDTGPVYGREAIEKYWAGLFKKFHVSNQADKTAPDSPHTIGTAGNEAWSHGQWKVTLQGQDGKPFDLTGRGRPNSRVTSRQIVTREPIASSCRDRTDHTGSRAPKSAGSARRNRGLSTSLANAAAPVLSESSTC
jgi:Domain of unknown function (DUF4440)